MATAWHAQICTMFVARISSLSLLYVGFSMLYAEVPAQVFTAIEKSVLMIR
jgi:hypothetical protein